MRVSGKTKVIGLIGDPIEHSISPILHNTISEDLRNDVVYVPFQVKKENLKEAIEGLKALNVLGFNVTVPHKIDIIPYLDGCDSLAQDLNAVNTVVNQGGKLIGYNTDGPGFYKSVLNHTGNLKGKRILMIGAGGAARGLSIFLGKQEVQKIYLINRSLEKAEALRNEIIKKCEIPCELIEEGQKCEVDVIVQATSVGMSPYISQSPLEIEKVICTENIYPDVYDIIYNPVETIFLKQAKNLGYKAINGFEMLMYQGILAYEKWLDIILSEEKKKKVIEEVKSKLHF